MSFYDKKRRIVVGNYDTFAIPFIIKNHIPFVSEEFVFTVRRVLDTTKRMGRPQEKSEIVFQQRVPYKNLVIIRNDNNEVVGCYFYVTATKEKAANIPAGINSYDLAVINDTARTELELIPPSEFIVGEVLRHG